MANMKKVGIRNKWTDAVLFTAEVPEDMESGLHMRAALEQAVEARAYLAGAYLAGANLAGANLADANLADAYLAGANLAGANLADAYLVDAYLAGANLARAYLAGANLARANLARANLADANLADAYLAGAKTDPASPEEIARLDAVREIVLKKPERLHMNDWHSSKWNPDHTPEEEHDCGSAHCIAGWLQALCPDKAVRQMPADSAGALLAPTQRHMFYTSNVVALQWLTDRAYARSEQVSASGAKEGAVE